jgi:hypothetical protein
VVLLVALMVARWRVPAPQRPGLPTRIWALYDQPDEFSFPAGEGGGGWPDGAGVKVERIRVENAAMDVPPELPLSFWPTSLPVLVVHSPRAWGFVQPLVDRRLGERVVREWPALLEQVVSPEKNFVHASGFDGDCLATDHRGALWRVGNVEDWAASRRIALDRPRDQPDNAAPLLTNRDPAHSKDLLGCYQPLARAPAPGALLALRYRARAESGSAHLQVYLSLPVVIPPDDTGTAASLIRSLDLPMQPEAADPLPNRWAYRFPVWVTPANDWQSYLVIFESPPFPSRVLHRNLVIDATGTGQIWVDDVALFAWQPGSAP